MSLSEKKRLISEILNYDMVIIRRVASWDKKTAAVLNKTYLFCKPLTDDYVLAIKEEVRNLLSIHEDRYSELNKVFVVQNQSRTTTKYINRRCKSNV